MRRGFTLVETLLTVALLVVAITIALGIFVNEHRTTTTAEAYDVLLSDARTSVDQIAQYLRNSTVDFASYQDPNHSGTLDAGEPVNLASPQGILKLVSLTGVRQVVKLGADFIVYTCITDPALGEAITKCDGSPPGTSWIPLTTNNSVVTGLTFAILPGSDPYSNGAARSAIDCTAAIHYSAALGACTCGVASDCRTDQICKQTSPSPVTSVCRPNPAADSLQPRVTILFNAHTKNGQTLRSPIETTVTSRVYLP